MARPEKFATYASARPRPRAGESEEFSNMLVDDLFGVGPDDPIDELAFFVEEERRDAHDPEGAGFLAVVVGVELAESDLPGVAVAQPIDDRRDHPARPAPRRPDV